jgi:hypothetical protein
MQSEVQSVQNRNKGPRASRKYILGSGNRVQRAETEFGVLERSESSYIYRVSEFFFKNPSGLSRGPELFQNHSKWFGVCLKC